jgi:hypothetical protein
VSEPKVVEAYEKILSAELCRNGSTSFTPISDTMDHLSHMMSLAKRRPADYRRNSRNWPPWQSGPPQMHEQPMAALDIRGITHASASLICAIWGGGGG